MFDWTSSITRRCFLWATGGLAAKALRPASERHEQADPLLRIYLAMYHFHDSVGRFPLPGIYNHVGCALLSWRVGLLPYLCEYELFSRFDLFEPWDSPQNLPLVDCMPLVYASPDVAAVSPGTTRYRVFDGPGAAFEGQAGTHVRDFTDGLFNTIMLVEAPDPVPWTKPEELRYDPLGPLPNLRSTFADRFRVICCDGTIKAIRNDFDEQRMRLAIVRNDGWGFPEEPNHP